MLPETQKAHQELHIGGTKALLTVETVWKNRDSDLQFLRQIPVVERDAGLDVVGDQFVDDSVVEIDSPLLDLVLGAVGHQARPGDGEPVVRRLPQRHETKVTQLGSAEESRTVSSQGI